MKKDRTIEELVKDAEEFLMKDAIDSFATGLRKHLNDPKVTSAPAVSWDEDPERTVFDGYTGLPSRTYEGPVLVFFRSGTCLMKTWIEEGARFFRPLGSD